MATFSEPLYVMQRRQPKHLAWLLANADTDEFAGSLLTRLKAGRELSDPQAAALDRIIARVGAPAPIAAAAAPAAAVAPAQPKGVAVEATALEAALGAAHAAGLQRPGLLTTEFKFSRAPDTGRNPGAIYVAGNRRTNGGADVYLGKIVSGQFIASRDCTDEQRAAVLKVAADPITAAIEYGKETGICSCCGRELTDPDSIARGIGPICAGKFFGS